MELEKKIKDILIKEWLVKSHLPYLGEALERINKRDSEDLKRKVVKHTTILDRHDLFVSIDNLIKFLKSLKEDGYVAISEKWSGYESNYFVGIKCEPETDEEYASRVYHLIIEEIYDMEEEKNKKEEKNKRIAELEKELRRLKSNN